MNKTLYIILPCYNEEEVLPETIKVLNSKLKELIKNKKISKDSKVLFINDGSKDDTWNIIKETSSKNDLFTGVLLSHNVGQQKALLAGYMVAKEHADVVVSMDTDLQDDISVIDEMIEKYNEGSDIIYGVRSSRDTDTWFKRNTALFFYKLVKKLGIEIVYNHAEYRLVTKRVLDCLSNYKEVNLFLRGIFPLIGFKSDIVYYRRLPRTAGKTKYPLNKLLSTAWEGITSFSIEPIKLILNLGIITSIISFILMIIFLVSSIINADFDTLIFIAISIYLSLGIILLSIGIIGEYIGKTYIESKHRPRYIISENLLEQKK
jgi:glycosyltransferase involved in cell wall biosynthesis